MMFSNGMLLKAIIQKIHLACDAWTVFLENLQNMLFFVWLTSCIPHTLPGSRTLWKARLGSRWGARWVRYTSPGTTGLWWGSNGLWEARGSPPDTGDLAGTLSLWVGVNVLFLSWETGLPDVILPVWKKVHMAQLTRTTWHWWTTQFFKQEHSDSYLPVAAVEEILWIKTCWSRWGFSVHCCHHTCLGYAEISLPLYVWSAGQRWSLLRTCGGRALTPSCPRIWLFQPRWRSGRSSLGLWSGI